MGIEGGEGRKKNSAGGHVTVEGSPNKKPAFGLPRWRAFRAACSPFIRSYVGHGSEPLPSYLRRSSRGRENAQRTSPKGTDPGAAALGYRSVHALILQPLHLSYYCSQSLFGLGIRAGEKLYRRG